MSAFTGLLMDNVTRPTSTAEVAAALGVPTVVVVACDMEGIEGALASSLNYVNLLRKLGVKTAGVILNKVRISYLTDEIRQFMKQAFANASAELLGIVPRIDLEGRGAIPEIEIRYEDFGAKAIEIAEASLDLDRIAKVAAPAEVAKLDYGALVERFKDLIMKDFDVDLSKDVNREKCL
jgi:cobyrinic acid a,c-diamide synthase